jgi:hypothetical protein
MEGSQQGGATQIDVLLFDEMLQRLATFDARGETR